jgi:hypothetical protein
LFSLQRAQPYKNWPQRDKGALQTAFDTAWNLRSIEVDDLPANILHPADDSGPATALSPADAYALYLASVGQSLAVEIDNRVGWSVADYSTDNLAVLFDSREFFVWSRAAHNGYQIQDKKGGYVVPASPHTMHGFLRDNDLIGPHRYQTIVRMLTWCHHNLHHFFGKHKTKIFYDVWQYRGEAPVLRTIQGTTDQANPSYGLRHWTAGCHGTAGFLRAILRTVNIPVVHEHQGGHALPHFSADGLHLSHGDDPYHQYTHADPPYPSPHHCCVIIATTRLRVNHTRTVQWRWKCRHTTRSRNSNGSIIFGQEWMPRLRAWAAAIISTIPPSDRIGRGSIAYVGAGHVSYSSHLRELFFD